MKPWLNASKMALAPLLAALVVDAAQGQQLRATLVTNAFDRPIILTSPPGDARLFVCEQHAGTIQIIENGSILPTPFLDLGAQVSTTGEQGLLGLAFHPDYANNRKLYVSYTDTTGASVIRSYLADAANPNQADPTSFEVVFGPLAQPTQWHNGGCVEFGTDEMLYYALGDGDPTNSSRSQDLGLHFGKLLRFDVDSPFPHVPADNPFVGDPSALDLIWAYGLRNPWRFSFDRSTGDLWIGDVGAAQREEIDFQPAASGGGENYGWACMEGTICTNDPQAGCLCTDVLVPPVHEYDTYSNGTCAVIGGHVYQGQLMPSMTGRYLFTDLCGGPLWSFEWDGSNVNDLTLHSLNIPGAVQATSLSTDAQGEIYLMDKFGGEIWRLEDDCQALIQNYCVTSPNSNGAGAIMSYSGSTSVTANDFVVAVTGSSSSQPGLFYYGQNQIQIPFGNGFRCVGSGGIGVFRLNPAMPSDGAGNAQRHVDFDQPPADSGPGMIQAGDTWNFQFWYRDPVAGGASFNLSDGLQADFCP